MSQRFRHLLLVTFWCLLFVGQSFAESKRPNLLLIVTDDQAPHTLKAYGNTVCRTPNIDRLAAEGMTLDAAYHMGAWVSAVCTPSRHMIMSGRSVWHIPGGGRSGHNPNRSNPRLVPPNLAEFTMAAVFNRAGYSTFRTCKKGNSYEAANKLFTVRRDQSNRGGTTEGGSAWHADQAIEFLNDRQKNNDREPFLMYLGFSHPHDTRDGTAELLKKYGATNATQPPTKVNPNAPPLQANYLPAHPFQFRPPGVRDEARVSGVLKSRTEATIRNELGREYACIENIDIQIGRVLRKLEAQRELDNTYVIFTSDHGIAVGRHGLTGKQNLYEHSWRVPMIVKGPGIKRAKRAAGNTYMFDLLPTLCEMASIKPPKTVEGSSFVPILKGKSDTVRDVLYGVFAGDAKPGMRCVRKGDWKLIKYDVLDGKLRKTQLFNLKENPNELLIEHHAADVIALTGNKPADDQINLADHPKHATKRKELEALLLSEQKRLDDPYRLWDQPAKDAK